MNFINDTISIISNSASLFSLQLPLSSTWLISAAPHIIPLGVFSRNEDLTPEETTIHQNLTGRVLRLSSVNRPIAVRAVRDLTGGIQAFGNNLLGRAEILYDPTFFERHYLNDAEIEFLLRSEVSKIRNNDFILPSLGGAVVSAIATLAMNILFPPIIAGIAVFVIAQIASNYFLQGRQRRADEDGCNEDPVNAISALEKIRQWRQERQSSSFWNRVFLTPEGEWRFDFASLSLQARIDSLQERNHYLNNLQEFA